MNLLDLLESIGDQFAAHADEPVTFALLKGSPDGWQISARRPIVGVRLGEDEVLLETSDPHTQGAQSQPITAGELLAQLRSLEAEYGERPVEACDPDVDVGGGVRVRADYAVRAFGRDEASGAHLLFCLLEDGEDAEPLST